MCYQLPVKRFLAKRCVIFSVFILFTLNASLNAAQGPSKNVKKQLNAVRGACANVQSKTAADVKLKQEIQGAAGAQAAGAGAKQIIVAKAAAPVVGLHIADKKEIDELAQKYAKPIVLKGIKGVKVAGEALVTKTALDHVFGMTIEARRGLLGLTGFHHDGDLKLEKEDRSFYRFLRNVDGQLEGFVAYRRDQLPVFKTFFPSNLSREQVATMLVESLQNVQNIEDQQGGKQKVQGKALNGILINTVIDEKGNIITFFPEAKTPRGEFKQEEKQRQALFKKFFLNLEHKPERKPITKKESEQLAKHYAQGIEVNWLLIGEYGLFKHDKQSQVQSNQKLIPKINVTAKALAALFAKEKDAEFPPYLSRKEIMQKIEQVLWGIADAKTFFFKEQDAHGNHLHFLGACSKGKDENDTFLFNIKINADSGDLEAVQPLFG